MNSTGGDAVEVRRDGITLHVAIWVTLGVALALWALAQATGSRWEWIGVGLGAGIAVGAAFGLRVRVLIDDETVNVVNPFRTSRIAFTDIERIEAGFVWWHWAFVAARVQGRQARRPVGMFGVAGRFAHQHPQDADARRARRGAGRPRGRAAMTSRWSVSGDEYQERFDRLAASGADIHGEADLVMSLEPRRVLDAGCGTGRVAIELARRGVAVAGVDVDPGMLETARRRARRWRGSSPISPTAWSSPARGTWWSPPGT